MHKDDIAPQVAATPLPSSPSYPHIPAPTMLTQQGLMLLLCSLCSMSLVLCFCEQWR